MKRFSKKLIFLSPLFGLFFYWVFILLGISLSFPIQVIPDETSQLLNIYGLINSASLKLPYETYYTAWVHYSFLPFTIIYWVTEYLMLGMPPLDEFKVHVAANYIDALPFLRAISALIFLFSAWLVSIVIKDKFSKKASYLFLFFLAFDLLLFINLHYSKHWIIDFAWIFISIYLYWFYLNNRSNVFLIFAVIFFSFAVLSSHPLIIAGLYHLYLLADTRPSNKVVIKDLGISISIFLVMFLLTLWLGPGKILSEIVFSGSSTQVQSNVSVDVISDFLYTLVDYNFLLTAFFVYAIFFMIIKKNFQIFLLIIPFLCYLLLISIYHFEQRYALFLIITMALVAAVGISKINNRLLLKPLILVMIFVNFAILLSWHLIIIEKDTRISTLEWIKNNSSDDSFIIYNTLGFNYAPITKKGINLIESNFPNAIGTRERLHLSLGLPDGINGIILRKIEEGGYKGPDLIRALISNGYKPVLTNERFGYDAYFHQPAPTTYADILDNCEFKVESIFLPYDQIPNNFEVYGDILYNFSKVIKSLRVFKRPGPIMTIYTFNQNQPKSC